MIKLLVGVPAALLLLVHGYFFIFFGTFDPCTAATFRVVNQQQSKAARGASLLFSGAMEKAIRAKGVLACYRIAITGEDPQNLL